MCLNEVCSYCAHILYQTSIAGEQADVPKVKLGEQKVKAVIIFIVGYEFRRSAILYF